MDISGPVRTGCLAQSQEGEALAHFYHVCPFLLAPPTSCLYSSYKKWQTNTPPHLILHPVCPADQRSGESSTYTSLSYHKSSVTWPVHLGVEPSLPCVCLSSQSKHNVTSGSVHRRLHRFTIVRDCSTFSGLSVILRMSLFFLGWPHSSRRMAPIGSDICKLSLQLVNCLEGLEGVALLEEVCPGGGL